MRWQRRQREYVHRVEGYREHGKNKQRVVSNLPRKDVLGAQLESLIELLRGEKGRAEPVQAGEVRATQAWDRGPMLVSPEVANAQRAKTQP